LKNFKIKRLTGLGYLKKIKSKSQKHQFWVFQKLQRTAGFHERTGKDPAVLGACLIYLKKSRTLVIYNNQVILFFDNCGYIHICQDQVFYFLIITVINLATGTDTRLGFSGAISNTRLTLMNTPS